MMKGKLLWKSEEEMQKELDKKISERKEGQSRDGKIIASEGEFEYKGIPYVIKVLRYYNHTNRFCAMGSRISDKYVLLEFPTDSKILVELIKFLKQVFEYEYNDFLWHDTLNSYNDYQTIEEQIDECHRMAKKDIDSLKDIDKRINEKVKSIKEIQKGIKKLLR